MSADKSDPTRALCSDPDPLGVIREEHALQLELCAVLESIADALPQKVDSALAELAISILERSMPAHMRLEEEALFPLLRCRCAAQPGIDSALNCLADEHEHDEGVLLEVAGTLRSVTAEGHVANPDMMGYLLRSFFESQRRHIAWEERVILPLARQVLTADDLKSIQGWIMSSGHPRCNRQSVLALREARSGAELCGSCARGLPPGLEIANVQQQRPAVN